MCARDGRGKTDNCIGVVVVVVATAAAVVAAAAVGWRRHQKTNDGSVEKVNGCAQIYVVARRTTIL
jgi:hypothetical protein